jgi:hypothetical protein
MDFSKPSEIVQRDIENAWAPCSAVIAGVYVCVFITAVPITKLFVWGNDGVGEQGLRVKERALGRLLCHIRRH